MVSNIVLLPLPFGPSKRRASGTLPDHGSSKDCSKLRKLLTLSRTRVRIFMARFLCAMRNRCLTSEHYCRCFVPAPGRNQKTGRSDVILMLAQSVFAIVVNYNAQAHHCTFCHKNTIHWLPCNDPQDLIGNEGLAAGRFANRPQDACFDQLLDVTLGAMIGHVQQTLRLRNGQYRRRKQAVRELREKRRGPSLGQASAPFLLEVL